MYVYKWYRHRQGELLEQVFLAATNAVRTTEYRFRGSERTTARITLQTEHTIHSTVTANIPCARCGSLIHICEDKTSHHVLLCLFAQFSLTYRTRNPFISCPDLIILGQPWRDNGSCVGVTILNKIKVLVLDCVCCSIIPI